MGTPQPYTNDLATIDTDTIERQIYMVSPIQQIWIDYKAVGGIIYDQQTETWEKWTVQKLANKLGVTRDALYKWRDDIPGFWDRVAERRKELNSGEWLAKMHETWKLKALKFDNWQLTESWLINFDPNYVSPKVKVEHDVSDNLVSLINSARVAQKKVIDGEASNANSQANT